MGRQRHRRLGDIAAMARLMARAADPPSEAVARKRRMVADLCRLLGSQYSDKGYQGPGVRFAPRLRQTLGRLLAGDSEKQIALHLGVSPHTVHVYVKRLYRHYDVCSRGELLSRFVRNPSDC